MAVGPPRVLHLNTERSFRGGEVQTLGLLRELARQGLGPLLAAPPAAPLAQRAAREGIPVFPWFPRGEADPVAAWRIFRLARREGVDLLHAHTAHALTPALAAGFLGGLPVVATRRVSFPIRGPLSRWKYRKASAVAAVSGAIARDLAAAGVPEGRLRVIHSAVDLERLLPLPPREEARRRLGLEGMQAVVGVAAALAHHKGHAVLFEALPDLLRGEPGLVVLLAGEGPLRQELQEHAEGRRLPVRFLGHLEDLRDFYASLDLLVLPSLSGEGSPGAVKEAAAAGVPVVATRSGGTGEVLREGREALLVPPGDAGALAEAVRRLLADRHLACRLAAQARERSRDFGMDRMAQAYLQLYGCLTGRAVPAGGAGDATGSGGRASAGSGEGGAVPREG